MNTSTATDVTPSAFQKAVVQDPEVMRGFHPSRGSVVVGSPEYVSLIARGFAVVETWNVWRCGRCGMNDSDRQPAEWEQLHLSASSHYDRYGHESTRA